jgi:hypothetical protein
MADASTQKPAGAAGKSGKGEVSESKRESFVRLAQARVPKVAAAFASLEQLARPANYDYTPADVDKIEQAVDAIRNKCITALRDGKIQKAADFKL